MNPHYGTPYAEFHLDSAFVAGLLADQHPDLADLPLEHADAGWDNVMFRLGPELAVRLPRRAAAAELICNEQTWLPTLAPLLPLPVPVPLRIGVPGRGYPWHWSIVPWLRGNPADADMPAASEAPKFAAFLRTLHHPAPANAPHNPVRGGPLAERAPIFAERAARVAAQTDLLTPEIMQIWHDALAAPPNDEPTWLHGDLHPRNILVHKGAISAVIDWGDLAAGGRATDLASLWLVFGDRSAREEALAAYGPLPAATLRRARGWAVHLAVALLDAGLVDNPRHAAVGAHTLRRLVE